MQRSRRIGRRLAVLAVTLAAAWYGLAAQAEETRSRPVGLRVFYTGHSFHMFVPQCVEQLVKSAGIQGHRLVGRQGIGGSRVIQHWELKDGANAARSALVSGDVDVFTMAAHLAVPDPGIKNFTELGLQHNPKLRLLVQASWMPWDLTASNRRIGDNRERDATDLDALDDSTAAWRRKLEAQADELNESHGRRAVFIVPVGDAVNRMRRMIVAGKFPGVARQSELFRDRIGHGFGHVRALAAYCNFVAIYHRTPEGLKLTESGVDEAQHAILQKIAWETVSGYSHSGLPMP